MVPRLSLAINCVEDDSIWRYMVTFVTILIDILKLDNLDTIQIIQWTKKFSFLQDYHFKYM
jgi:hypothetical protein